MSQDPWTVKAVWSVAFLYTKGLIRKRPVATLGSLGYAPRIVKSLHVWGHHVQTADGHRHVLPAAIAGPLHLRLGSHSIAEEHSQVCAVLPGAPNAALLATLFGELPLEGVTRLRCAEGMVPLWDPPFVGRLQKLRVLNLANCGLATLPVGLYLGPLLSYQIGQH